MQGMYVPENNKKKTTIKNFNKSVEIHQLTRLKNLNAMTGSLSSPVSGYMSETALARPRSNHSTVYLRLKRLKFQIKNNLHFYIYIFFLLFRTEKEVNCTKKKEK